MPVGSIIENNEVSHKSRNAYGEGDLGFWSPLTSFEILVLKANHTNYDHFLALALVGSGDARTQKEFLAIKKDVQSFIQDVTPKINHVKEFWRKGSILYHEVQKKFYPSVFGSKPFYRFHQTKLSTLIHKGEYNCISSAILYGIFAHHFGLHPEGVFIPSHAFVQITDDKTGKVVEVETTNANGYDQLHDKEYYESTEQFWYTSRDLNSITYEDYQNRGIYSLRDMIIYNMSHQHARTNTMSLEDRMRLIEIKAYLLPTDESHRNTLAFMFQEEAYRLLKTDSVAYERFIQVAQSKMITLMEYQKSSNYIVDIFRWLAVEDSRWRITQGQHTQALSKLSEYSSYIPESDSNYVKMKNVIGENYFYALDTLIKQHKLKDAELFQKTYYSMCKEGRTCVQNYPELYNNWIRTLWNNEDWNGAVRLLKTFKKLKVASLETKKINKDTETAYKNWARDLYDNNKRASAKTKLKECLKDIKGSLGCKSLLNDIRL